VRRLRRFLTTWRAVSAVLQYADTQIVWSDKDRKALALFLETPAGAKMERLMADQILDACQTAVSEQCKPFDAGTVHGMKILWVFMKTLTSAGATPQLDPNNERDN